MAAPQNEYSFDYDQLQRSAARWQEREEKRAVDEKLIKEGRYDELESKERLAMRVNRLLDKVKQNLPAGIEPLSRTLSEALEQDHLEPEQVDYALTERVIGETRDFLSAEFVEKASLVNRCVGRIVTRLSNGRKSYGTGFMVSPQLLLTNQHVLKNAEAAENSQVEFDYQNDGYGRPKIVQRFDLDSKVFFLNDKDLDYALVAVNPTSETRRRLSEYGWLPLIRDEGKIRLHEAINITQHPRGEMKQIVLRSNKLLDLLEKFAHYEADTEPGSSGSPVFNDQWEVVALHHMGVPKTNRRGEFLSTDGSIWKKGDDPSRLAWVANEGVRVSRLFDSISQAKVQPHEKDLLDELLKAAEPEPPENASSEVKPNRPNPEKNMIGGQMLTKKSANTTNTVSESITFTLPLQITVSLGQVTGNLAATEDEEQEVQDTLEAIEPDRNYENRPGYNPNFLGFSVPLPKLSNGLRPKAFALPSGKFELKYYNYSILFNQERRLAFLAAVNFNPTAPFQFKREGKDKWYFDPRVDKKFQAGEKYYSGNPLDRGHLVRRADAAWGNTTEEAKLANDDTFHFTNCSPQHEVFNQSSKASQRGVLLWGNIENHIANQGRVNRKKLSIFNGPIFRMDDRLYREDLQLPKQFWKIIVFKTNEGQSRALAFVLSQEELIKDLPEEDFEEGSYKPFQVKIRDLEALTKLDFGALRSFDPLENEANESFFEEGTDVVPITRMKDMVL